MKQFYKLLLSTFIFFVFQFAAKAQSINESFNDITDLTGKGWTMINMSSFNTGGNWITGAFIPPYSGKFIMGQRSVLTSAGVSNNGRVSCWLISPPRLLSNGDVISFYTRQLSASMNALQARVSYNGTSSNVGVDQNSVGDFTDLKLDLFAGPATTVWQLKTFTISGLGSPTVGRIALRYYVEDAGTTGSMNNGTSLGIDEFVYNPMNDVGVTSGNSVHEFSNVPMSQFTPFALDARVDNLGQNNQTGMSLTAKVFKAPDYTNAIQTHVSSSFSLTTGSFSNISTGGTFAPTLPGTYRIKYYLTSPVSQDATASNDTLTYNINLTDHLYSRDEGAIIASAGTITNSNEFGSVFPITTPTAIDSIFANLSKNAGTSNAFVIARVWTNGDLAAVSDTVFYSAATSFTGQWVKFKLRNPYNNNPVLLTGNCIISIEKSTLDVLINASKSKFTANTYFYRYDIYSSWFTTNDFLTGLENKAIMLRAYLNSCAASAVPTNVTCFSSPNNGSIVSTASLGTSPFTYSWSNGGNTNTINSLAQGNYNLTLTDALGCKAHLTVPILRATSPLSIAFTPYNAVCNGTASGYAIATANGGFPPYTYNWASGSTDYYANNLAAGNYGLTVTDANGTGCVTSTLVTIANQYAPLAATFASTNVTCAGASNGTYNFTITGGLPPYNVHNWTTSSQGTNTSANGLAPNTYFVQITDNNTTCYNPLDFNITITEPDSLKGNIIAVTPCGSAATTLKWQATGGTQNYNYLWSNGNTNNVFNTPLVGSTYNSTITDANGCKVKSSIAFAGANPLIASITIANPTNCNSYDGSATAVVSGGEPPYSYYWYLPSQSTNNSIQFLSNGNYPVEISDASGCVVAKYASVVAPGAPTIDISGKNISCFGTFDGEASITVGGVTGGYSWSWNVWSISQNLTGLSTPGYYYVTVQDNITNCSATSAIKITSPDAIVVSELKTDHTCFGDNLGAIQLTTSGGVPSYTYSWSNGSTAEDLTNLTGNFYAVTVTDATNCTNVLYYSLNAPSEVVAYFNTYTSVTTCFGSDGSISGAAYNGTPRFNAPNYDFLWSNGTTNATITGIPKGNYTLTVTDSLGCKGSITQNLTSYDQPDFFASTARPTCNGDSNGKVNSISPFNGTAPYTFLWFNGKTTTSITGLTSGSYPLTITDATGCDFSKPVVITQYAQIVPTTVVAHTSNCKLANDGSINLNAITGGSNNYSYDWGGGNNGTYFSWSPPSINSLTPANYNLTITDTYGCQKVFTYAVNLKSISTTVSQLNPTCNGFSNGSISITALDGGDLSYPAYYTYDWSTASTNDTLATLQNLSVGSYSCAVLDTVTGCAIQVNQTLIEPALLTATTTFTSITCNGLTDGKASITANGGTGAYTYRWSNNSTLASLLFLSAGNYSCTVSDANGCVTTKNGNIINPAVISTTTVITDQTSGSNGGVNLTPSGGTPAFTYAWSNGTNAEDLNGVVAGNYSCTVTDANGCKKITAAEVKSLVGLSDALSNSENIFVYPNPSNGEFHIQFMESQNRVKVSVSNAIGQVVLEKEMSNLNAIDLNLSNESAGIFMLNLQFETKEKHIRLIKY